MLAMARDSTASAAVVLVAKQESKSNQECVVKLQKTMVMAAHQTTVTASHTAFCTIWRWLARKNWKDT
jgi:hypothetical protein